MSVVLMYHALFPDGDCGAVDIEDQPYAVSVSDFTRQMDMLANHRVGLYANRDCPDIVITFDDGHASNLQLAAPLLVERGLSAYFFVTTDFIGKRSGFMNEAELGELSDMPGMCIGSHGVTHRFFDDMSTEESIRELVTSRQILESICSSSCRSMSLPGGRFARSTLPQFSEAGYTQWFGSAIGLVSSEIWQADSAAGQAGATQSDRWQLSQQNSRHPLSRVAIRANTQVSEFQRIIDADESYFRGKRIKSQLKHAVRRLIGNRIYHGLYTSFAAR